MDKKLNAIYLSSSVDNVNYVYDDNVKKQLSEKYNISDKIYNKKEILANPEISKKTDYIFSTWGMERFTCEEIKDAFPNVKALFYGAGSVQDFAKEFIESGIRVFSAWQANAVPVAEYTYAQIILAAKGFYQAERMSRFHRWKAFKYSKACGGNYNTKIGILGVGSIGKAVAKKLMDNKLEVYYYDPFLKKEIADELNLKEATLEDIFKNCDVITNHLANKDELSGIINAKLLNTMKPYATLINTGRGRQINEKDLYKAMKQVKTRTAVLDVTFPEPTNPFGYLRKCKNIIITPHIAGSIGRETVRMAQYMVDEANRLDNGEALYYEVTAEMLKTMA